MKKNIFIDAQCRQPESKDKVLEEQLKTFLNKTKIVNKPTYTFGDLNLSLFEHYVHAKGDSYLSLFFQNDNIPVIYQLTRIPKTNATFMDHISSNSF